MCETNARISVHCITFLDKFRHEIWPKDFATRPEKGDLVKSNSGKILTIHTITHCESRSELYAPYLEKDEPYLEVHIHN